MGCGGSKDKSKDGKTESSSGGSSASGNRDQDKKAAKEENKDFAQTMSFLTKVPLFKRLPKDQHPLLAAACVSKIFKAGEVIIKQGDTGNEFFIIKNGEATVDVGGNKVATLKDGDYLARTLFFEMNQELQQLLRTQISVPLR